METEFEPTTLLNLTKDKIRTMDSTMMISSRKQDSKMKTYTQGFHLLDGESLSWHAEMLAKGFIEFFGIGKKLFFSAIACSEADTVTGTITCGMEEN